MMIYSVSMDRRTHEKDILREISNKSRYGLRLASPFMPDCSIQERTYSIIGLFAIGRRALGHGSSPWSPVKGRSLGDMSHGQGWQTRDALVPEAGEDDSKKFARDEVGVDGGKIHVMSIKTNSSLSSESRACIYK